MYTYYIYICTNKQTYNTIQYNTLHTYIHISFTGRSAGIGIAGFDDLGIKDGGTFTARRGAYDFLGDFPGHV